MPWLIPAHPFDHVSREEEEEDKHNPDDCTLGGKKGADEVLRIASLAAVGTEGKGIEAAVSTKTIQAGNVCPQVVRVVRVGRVHRCGPLGRRRNAWMRLLKATRLWLRLVINGIKAGD